MVLSRRKLKVGQDKQGAEQKPLDEVADAAKAGKRTRDVAVSEKQAMDENKQKRKKRKKVRKAADDPEVTDAALAQEIEARRLRKKLIKANRRIGKEGGKEAEANEKGLKELPTGEAPAAEGDNSDGSRSRKKQMEANRNEGAGAGELPKTSANAVTVKELQNGGNKANPKQKQRKKKGANRWGEKDRKDHGTEMSGVEESGDDPASTRDGSRQEQYERKKVFVGGMPYSVTEDDILEYFSDCGRVAELDCVTFPDTGKFRGLVFITFETEAEADKALALDGADMWGRYLKVQRCKLKEPTKVKPQFEQPPSKHPDCLSAYIGNLAWDVSEEELREFFRDCDIVAIRFAHDKNTGEFRGFGHVDFANDTSLDTAISLDQQEVHGRPIKIAYAVPKRH